MSPSVADIQKALQARSRYRQRLEESETPADRLERFVRLQEAAFELLRSSPEGFRHFIQRNMRSRRDQVIDGKWKPITADRCAIEA